ncbi:hypothetical protein [Chenggangzhangella methanolivorans]|uniref:Uncharacterized protein n=1 Tax=Chenggangzhangella methanolivorans TaxID=1437009 RepID=A0A9E6UKX0_9HYPH|nr:hypothetical protein [Chenggangzhangella methanolivorans]QZN98350.1 hypothetical protein K6K41_14635 [Chenggangzhangella methanolivorans]
MTKSRTIALALALVAAFSPLSALAADGFNTPPAGYRAPQAAPGDLGSAIMSAVVDPDGTLVRGEGAVSAQRFFEGAFGVEFGRDVTACAFVVSIGGSDAQGTPEPGLISAVGRLGEARQIFVSTKDAKARSVDRPFHLIVYCGR